MREWGGARGGVRARTCAEVCMLRPEMSVLGVFFYHSPPYFLKLCLSLNHVHWASHQAPGSSRLWLPSDQISVAAGFSVGPGDLNSQPCVSTGSISLTEPFHQPHVNFPQTTNTASIFPTAYGRSLSGRATGRSAASP